MGEIWRRFGSRSRWAYPRAPCITPISRMHLPYISHASPQYLARISPMYLQVGLPEGAADHQPWDGQPTVRSSGDLAEMSRRYTLKPNP